MSQDQAATSSAAPSSPRVAKARPSQRRFDRFPGGAAISDMLFYALGHLVIQRFCRRNKYLFFPGRTG